LERVSRAEARSGPTGCEMSFFSQEQKEKLLAQADEHRPSLKRPTDRRFVADLEAGKPYKLAREKLRSRLRAAARRWALQPARVAEDLALNKRWAEAHDHLLEGSKLEGGSAFEDTHEHRFEGDEGLEPNLERKPYSKADWRKHTAEKDQPALGWVKARSWVKPKHATNRTIEARVNANKKREARRKVQRLVQRTAAPKWHAAKKLAPNVAHTDYLRARDKRETLSWEEQAADKAAADKRPRTKSGYSKFPLAPWASTSSSSGGAGPKPPVFGPPAGPPPGQERPRSPEAEAVPEEDEQSLQFSVVGCRKVQSWSAEIQKLTYEL
jgi:hypothetical protein